MNFADIKKLIIAPEVSLKVALRILEASGHRILFVVNDDDKFIGTVTDGDIMRSILSGIGFERPVFEIMCKSPRFVKQYENEFRGKAKKYIVDEKLHAIPVLDEAERLVDVLFWHEFLKKHPLEPHTATTLTNPVVIMAGGKGARLDPFTKILPKPLIPLGDKPIIEKIMDNFHRYGFNSFILTLNYRKELIKMYFKETILPYNLEWVEEDKYLGTAGGLGLLKDKIKETFFVCNCDILLNKDFKNILLWHKGEKALMTLIGYHKEIVFPYGMLEVNRGCLQSINEKLRLDAIINTGVYVVEPGVLKFISPGEHIDMNNLVERVMQEGKVTVYPVCDGWFDTGQWKEYKESLYLLQNNEKKSVNE